MRAFIHIVRLSFQQQLTYRLATLAGLATNLFFGLLRALVLIALYNGRGEFNQMTLTDAITYVAITQAMIAFMTLFGGYELIQTVSDGSVGADLLKPLDFFVYWLGRDVGKSLVNFFGRGVLFMPLFALFFSIVLPEGWENWLALGGALILGWLISFAWRFLCNLPAFWVQDARGIARFGFTLPQFLSGFVFPLRLYPEWFQQFCNLTPFPAMVNTSVEVYLGLLTGDELLHALAVQVLWIAALIPLCYLVLRLGLRRLVIQGG